jgi:hypothetical protein
LEHVWLQVALLKKKATVTSDPSKMHPTAVLYRVHRTGALDLLSMTPENIRTELLFKCEPTV